MRYVASIPFLFLLLACAVVTFPLWAFTTLVLKTLILVRGDDVHGPSESRGMTAAHHGLAYLEGRCWKCGTYVGDDD